MSGSGGDAGYDYQANAIAYIAAHALSEHGLGWFEDSHDVPSSWSAETGGPGDDIAVTTEKGEVVEVQAKHRFKRGDEYIATFRRLIAGLRADPQLRVVLLIDRHATEIIRTDLKADIERIGKGRTDSLKRITSELLTELSETPDPSVFSRFRITVVDLDAGSDGITAIHSFLSHVVETEKTGAAYELLGKRGHALIKGRGRDDTLQCARYLDAKLGLVPSLPLSVAALARFANWTRTTNAQFYSPALQRHFPITDAWSKVRRWEDNDANAPGPTRQNDLESELRKYQEWARLANGNRRDKEVDAELLIDGQRRVVIVGGPGSGKTTLGKKLAFLTSEEHVGIRVRLPLIAVRCRTGAMFETALVEAVIDSSGLSEHEGKRIVNIAEYLIADGLDECDPSRADIAAGLVKWAESHPHTHLCVLTRPIGHSPALLPGFIHAELLPLEEHEVRDIASNLISSHIEDEKELKSLSTGFMEALGTRSENKTASIAARNPLLLSFLVRLFLDKQPLAGKRSQLFDRIIELIRKSPPVDRVQFSSAAPEFITAWIAAEVLGWSSIETPERPLGELYSLVAQQFGGGIQNVRGAESAVRLWSDHGLVEHISVGSRDAVVFIHLALGEYLAGRHLAKSGDDFLERIVTLNRRKAKWREPILLAAGTGAAERIVKLLLSLDDPEDPQSTEAVLAAACLAEVNYEAILATLYAEITEKLKNRLCSNVPLIAIEAGNALVQLAPLIPELVSQIALDLWDNPQIWTRLAASSAGLATESRALPIEEIVEWIETEDATSSDDSMGRSDVGRTGSYELRKSGIPRALKRIAEDLPHAEAEKHIAAFLSRGKFSMGIFQAVQAELADEPFKTWVQKAWEDMTKNSDLGSAFVMFLKGHDLSRRGEIVVMNCIISLNDSNLAAIDGAQENRFSYLGRLLSSMGFWDMSMGDLISIDQASAPVVTEILRGMIAGLELDSAKLKQEAENMLKILESSEGRLWVIPNDKREPDWEKTRLTNLNIALLAEALHHHSELIAWNAARLLEMHDFTESERGILQNEFFATKRNLILFGKLASSIWEGRAFAILQTRLNQGLTTECGCLFKPLIEAARTDEQWRHAVVVALEGVGAQSAKLAEDAGEALRVADSAILAEHCQELTRLFAGWKNKGSWCAGCKKSVFGSSCPDCHVVPPSPRKHLVFLLVKGKCISVERLLELSEEEEFGVAEEARKALIEWGLGDDAVLDAVLSTIEGSSSLGLLNELLNHVSADSTGLALRLQNLLHSNSPAIRARILDSFGSGWIPLNSAKALANEAINDEAPNVRSSAVRFLRLTAET